MAIILHVVNLLVVCVAVWRLLKCKFIMNTEQQQQQLPRQPASGDRVCRSIHSGDVTDADELTQLMQLTAAGDARDLSSR